MPDTPDNQPTPDFADHDLPDHASHPTSRPRSKAAGIEAKDGEPGVPLVHLQGFETFCTEGASPVSLDRRLIAGRIHDCDDQLSDLFHGALARGKTRLRKHDDRAGEPFGETGDDETRR